MSKKIKIEVVLSIGLIHTKKDVIEFEVDDNATDNEIIIEAEEATEEWANDRIEYYYKIIE